MVVLPIQMSIGAQLAQLESTEIVLFGADWVLPGTEFTRLALAIQLKP
jgi:hypothetical protein